MYVIELNVGTPKIPKWEPFSEYTGREIAMHNARVKFGLGVFPTNKVRVVEVMK